MKENDKNFVKMVDMLNIYFYNLSKYDSLLFYSNIERNVETMSFWTDLSIIEKVFVFIAAPATMILLIQLVLQLFGLGSHADGTGDFSGGMDAGDGIHPDSIPDADSLSDSSSDSVSDSTQGMEDGNGPVETRTGFESNLHFFQFITLQGIIAFFAISGWTGLFFLLIDLPSVIAILLALLCGTLALLAVGYLLKSIWKLQSDGTVKARNAIGLEGEVYLKIPGDNKGKGKINITVQERYKEYDAITYEKETLLTGTSVRVVDMVSNDLLVVEKRK